MLLCKILQSQRKNEKIRHILGIQHQLPTFCPLFKCFVEKCKFLRTSSTFLLLGVTLASNGGSVYEKQQIGV